MLETLQYEYFMATLFGLLAFRSTFLCDLDIIQRVIGDFLFCVYVYIWIYRHHMSILPIAVDQQFDGLPEIIVSIRFNIRQYFYLLFACALEHCSTIINRRKWGNIRCQNILVMLTLISKTWMKSFHSSNELYALVFPASLTSHFQYENTIIIIFWAGYDETQNWVALCSYCSYRNMITEYVNSLYVSLCHTKLSLWLSASTWEMEHDCFLWRCNVLVIWVEKTFSEIQPDILLHPDFENPLKFGRCWYLCILVILLTMYGLAHTRIRSHSPANSAS